MFKFATKIVDLSEGTLHEYASKASISVPSDIFFEHLDNVLSHVQELVDTVLKKSQKNKTPHSYLTNIAFSFLPMLNPLINNFCKKNNLMNMYILLNISLNDKNIPTTLIQVGDNTLITKSLVVDISMNFN